MTDGLCPFNKRIDEYGGTIANRMRLLLEAIEATRDTVGTDFPIAVKLNASDQLADGFHERDALQVVAALERSSVDLIDISGGTYFPGVKSASDSAGKRPYFIKFAERARTLTNKPLMLTGGFKTRLQAKDAVEVGAVDVVGLARTLVLEPTLPDLWKTNQKFEPDFPRFSDAPQGGITAWYTMRLTEIGTCAASSKVSDLGQALQDYEARDQSRTAVWLRHFASDATR
jgi:2,4-dienoyl-CoA reductase-like NADH-dependent reductase (Old Yellow Enzyme family)